MSFYEDRIFPHLLDWATRPLQRDRETLIGQASGRVLELGVGTGANFPFYTARATEIHGVEPTAALLERARESAARCRDSDRFVLRQASAESLPYPDDHFDTVVACLVFCTIPDPEAAATEMHRVLKPGGQVLVLEHVASEATWTARAQGILNPVWRPLACGCNLNRHTADLFGHCGFDLRDTQHARHPKMPALAGELFSGVARKR